MPGIQKSEIQAFVFSFKNTKGVWNLNKIVWISDTIQEVSKILTSVRISDITLKDFKIYTVWKLDS